MEQNKDQSGAAVVDVDAMTTTERDGDEAGIANKPDPNPYRDGSKFRSEWQSGFDTGRAECLSWDIAAVRGEAVAITTADAVHILRLALVNAECAIKGREHTTELKPSDYFGDTIFAGNLPESEADAIRKELAQRTQEDRLNEIQGASSQPTDGGVRNG